MCATCGCGSDEVRVIDIGKPRIGAAAHSSLGHSHDDFGPHDHDHAHHDHDHGPHDHDHAPHDHARNDHAPHDHDHDHPPVGRSTTITLEQRVLAKNDERAQFNRGWLAARHLFAVNLMSSPGAGKTTILERTIRDLLSEITFSVIEGDQETTLDADRISAAGAHAVQVNTGSGCHLDADMVADALRTLEPDPHGVVLIENVGNLVCPALFDLGEDARVVITSVTEGVGKPVKYPHVFRSADLVLLNKTDLLPYVDFDVDRFRREVASINPSATVIQVCATRDNGLAAWYEWLRRYRESVSATT